ncbi:MAG: histidine phosphatase family protein [Desulfobacterales bacterium]
MRVRTAKRMNRTYVDGRFPITLKMLVIAGMLWLSAGAAPAAPAQPQTAGEAITDAELVSALRNGGYHIYFRHAASDWSRQDRVTAEGDWKSCDPARMRQLSEDGRAVARRIGEVIRRLAIPVGRIQSTEYCRTRETAELMKLGPVTTTRELMNMRAAEFFGGRNAVVERARRLLSTPPAEGTNTVMVAHGNLLLAVSGSNTVEAGAAVFKPQGGETFSLVTRLSPEDWERLLHRFGR